MEVIVATRDSDSGFQVGYRLLSTVKRHWNEVRLTAWHLVAHQPFSKSREEKKRSAITTGWLARVKNMFVYFNNNTATQISRAAEPNASRVFVLLCRLPNPSGKHFPSPPWLVCESHSQARVSSSSQHKPKASKQRWTWKAKKTETKSGKNVSAETNINITAHQAISLYLFYKYATRPHIYS